jgi:drug/metabolite transporter (DMT)-like permease
VNYLLITSLLWAFSFGLIKRYLVGLDAGAVSVVRLALAFLVFLPFLKLRRVTLQKALFLLTVGFIQFGLMYVAYLQSFRYLESFQVALFTLFTPLWVTLVNDALLRRFHPRFLGVAILAVLGAATVTFQGWGEHVSWTGFGLVQLSNFCFALGQVGYVRWMRNHGELRDLDVFGFLYAGGVLGALIVSLGTGGWAHFAPTTGQLWVLAYLGLVASGLGFFWWNRGARFVGGGTLAVMNNLKIPLGVACSLLVFGERTNGVRLGLGGLLILGALWINRRDASKSE